MSTRETQAGEALRWFFLNIFPGFARQSSTPKYEFRPFVTVVWLAIIVWWLA